MKQQILQFGLLLLSSALGFSPDLPWKTARTTAAATGSEKTSFQHTPKVSSSTSSSSSLLASPDIIVDHAIASSSMLQGADFSGLTALLQELWREYNVVLEAHPLYTKCATSLVGFTIGDFLAQNFVEEREKGEPYDIIRTLRLASFGVLVHATSGHYFYGFLDQQLPGTSGVTIVEKVAIDQILWAPIFTAWFFGYNFLLEGKSLDEYVAKLKSDLITGVRGSWSFWAPAHAINFAIIPPSQRLLYINVLQIIYNIFLSFLGNKDVDDDAAASNGNDSKATAGTTSAGSN